MTYYILSKPLASESCNLSPLLYEHPQSTSSYSAPHNPLSSQALATAHSALTTPVYGMVWC